MKLKLLSILLISGSVMANGPVFAFTQGLPMLAAKPVAPAATPAPKKVKKAKKAKAATAPPSNAIGPLNFGAAKPSAATPAPDAAAPASAAK